MKVLWFSNTPGIGEEYLNKANKIKGTGGWMYSLNKYLQEKAELSLVFHYPYKIEPFQYQKTTYYPVYTGNIILQNLKKRFWKKVYDMDFMVAYLNVINEVKPDIIHIHGTENSFLCIIGKTAIPVVVSIQGNLTVIHHKFLSGFHGMYIHKKSQGFNLGTLLFGKSSFCTEYNNIKKMSVNEQIHLKRANYVIGRTTWDKRITSILAPERQYYIGNEILRDKFYENKWNSPYHSGKITLFTTNGNSYYKGFETLCHSLRLLNSLGINVEWRVAGVSAESLINKITKMKLREFYPQKGLVLLGSIAEEELINNLKESNIYVMTSHIENSPNNLCEAMIIGMPCIATFAGGTCSMLKDGKEGILIQDGDPWAMAGAVIELINNIDKAVQYGEAARKRALKRHDKNEIIEKLLKTYKTIILNYS
jgi:glycosyltransferase involved in cell wall biosynthesis